MKFVILIMCIIIFQGVSHASSFIDITEMAVSTGENSSEEKQDVTQNVIQKISEKYIIELIGEEKFLKNKKSISDKVIRESGKYIPFVKTVPNGKDNTGKNLYAVNLRISTQSLMDMLAQNGFMNAEYSSAIVYPMIQVTDRINAKSYKWWIESTKDEFLLKIHSNMIQDLQLSLKQGNFFVLDPAKWNLLGSVPSHLKKDFYRRDDVIALGDYFQTPLIIQGGLEISPSQRTSQNFLVKVKMSAYLASQGKVISESIKSKETETGDFYVVVPKMAATLFKEVFEDLGSQIQESWKKSGLNSSSLQLTLLGNLSYQGQENFKKALLQSVSKLRSITEASVESNKRTFNLDYTGTAEELGQKIDNLKANGLQVKLKDVSWKEVEVKVEER